MQTAPPPSTGAAPVLSTQDEAVVSASDCMESWRSRLRAFYWAHGPRKVDHVEEILARYEGHEEQFLQQVHREFGVRDFGGEEAIDDIYEHQRYSYLSFSWGSTFPGHLLPTDRHQWSGLHGSPSSQTREKVEPQLPVNWEWTSDWVVDKTSCKCDADGWVYALDFTMINYLIKRGEERSEPNATDYVRRRRWVRSRRRVHKEVLALESEIDDSGKVVNTCSGDEQKWVVESGSEGISDDAAAAKSEGSDRHRRPGSPMSPQAQAESSQRVDLKHFSLTMDKAEFDTSWKEEVRKLEQIYTRAKDCRVKKKQGWAVKKEKIRRQIHLLEKSILSMQAVAEEEKRRQSEKPRSQPSPRHSDRAMPSPVSASRPTSISMDSPTNVINLASRLLCAQSKLDALRRDYWHPRENDYTLRFSIDGIFYGLRDFFLESFKCSFLIQISHQTNGAQGITPTCKVKMKGHTVCSGKHVKVVGEKGTRIPKSIWDSMYMDSDFEASICLIYVEDVNDLSMAQGSWEFLCSPEATSVELINFTRRVKGGMDLPEPMVRKLCSDVLTSLVRDLTLLYFPYELALAFNLPPGKLDVNGELEIMGQPIDDVMEKELEMLNVEAIHEDEAKQNIRRQATDAEEMEDEGSTPINPILDVAANATQMFTSLRSGSDKKMQVIAKLLQLSPAQFNLLMALKGSQLFPSSNNFGCLASICAYYKAFSVEVDGNKSQEENLRATWGRILELVYIRKLQACGVKTSNDQAIQQFELFNIEKVFDVIKLLSRKPATVQVSVKHFYCTLNALNVVEALSKLYERVILGIDYSKPRTGADGFMYGIRLGRKATAHSAMVMAAAAAAATAAAATAASTVNGEVHPVGSPPVLDLRRYRPAEVSFRTRVQTFSKFWQTLKKVIEFVRENVEDVSAELAGIARGTGDDCILNGSFKDADYRGPMCMGVTVPPCFLGFYRTEMIALGNGRVGMQVDAMLPSTSTLTAVSDSKQKPTTIALESIGRIMFADLTSEVLLDLDALIAHEKQRRDAAASTSPVGSPRQDNSGTASPRVKSSLSPTNVVSPKQIGSPRHSAPATNGGARNKANQHCALKFSFGSTMRDATNDRESKTGAFGQLNVSTSEFTKMHTTAKAGSFMLRLTSLVEWVLDKYVRPQVLKAFPQHQMLFDTVKASLMQLLRSPKLEVNFDVMARAFIHDDESLMVTLCGSPLHPTPLMYRDEVKLLDIILQADDLVNIWIDDRYPPYSNPLYF